MLRGGGAALGRFAPSIGGAGAGQRGTDPSWRQKAETSGASVGSASGDGSMARQDSAMERPEISKNSFLFQINDLIK